MSDVRAAGELARAIATREVAPHVDAWGAPDGPGVPDAARAVWSDAGLLDDDLPAGAAVEVALALGGAGLRAAVAIMRLDPSGAPGDLRLAAALCGAARALLDAGLDHARQRVVFGRELARFPVQRHAFALATARVESATALCRRAAPGGEPLDRAAAPAAAAAAAWLAAETALQVHGGYGYTDEHRVSRMWREVVAVRAALDVAALDRGVGAAAGLVSG